MDVHEPYIPVKSTVLERIRAIRLYNKCKTERCLPKHHLEIYSDLYDREIEYVDREIESFLDEVDRMSISLDNTYIVLTSDHGEQLMDHGLVGHGYLYDELVRVPLIIAGPGVEENVSIEEQVCLLDLGPTILDLLDIPKVESFQGRSLLPAMDGHKSPREGVISEEVPFPIHDVISGEVPFPIPNGFASRFSYRTHEWKYILVLSEDDDALVSEELYDLRNDPKERESVVEKEREIAEKFRMKLLDHIAMEKRERLRTDATKERPELEYREEEKKEIEKRLRSLGYM